MSQNIINLTIRFLLELSALYAFGRWGWSQRTDFWRYLLMIGLPVIAAVLWGLFRVPGDTSASGNAVIAIHGWLRLLLELGFFSFAAYCFFLTGLHLAGWVFTIIAILHYILSYDRILWLMKN